MWSNTAPVDVMGFLFKVKDDAYVKISNIVAVEGKSLGTPSTDFTFITLDCGKIIHARENISDFIKRLNEASQRATAQWT